jgi:hypothetical protein
MSSLAWPVMAEELRLAGVGDRSRLNHRGARARRSARTGTGGGMLEHALRCRHPDYQSCPQFQAMVLARLAGMDLAEPWTAAHSAAVAAPVRGGMLNGIGEG